MNVKVLSRIESAEQHFCQLAEPSQHRKRRKELEQNGGGHDHDHIAYRPAQHPLRERRVGRLVISGPGKGRFPLFLRNGGRPDPLERHPGAVSRNAALARNGVSQPERIMPPDIAQPQWEEAFAWPANNKPPYPPLAHRMLRAAISYVVVVLAAAVLLQAFTPFPVLTWFGALTKMLLG